MFERIASCIYQITVGVFQLQTPFRNSESMSARSHRHGQHCAVCKLRNLLNKRLNALGYWGVYELVVYSVISLSTTK